MTQRNAYGSDTLHVPAYLATGPDDPGLDEWKREHPGWFEAGTWTRPLNGTTGRRRGRDAPRPLDRDRSPLDPATLSVADFQRTAAQERQAGPSARSSAAMDPRPPQEEHTNSSWPTNGMEQPKTIPVAHSNPDGGHALVLNDGTPVLDQSGQPILIPPGVDLNRNLDDGRSLSTQPFSERLATLAALMRPGGRMDYQRTNGKGEGDPTHNDINRSYMPFGSFNYGAMMAAAGLSLEMAERDAGLANQTAGDQSGPLGTNPATLPYIIQGYQAYDGGLVGRK